MPTVYQTLVIISRDHQGILSLSDKILHPTIKID